VRYRRDGYCWKKRKDGKTTREDHMKLKVQGIEVSWSTLYKGIANINENQPLIFSKLKYMRHISSILSFSAFMVVTFIPQFYQHFTGDVIGYFR
jgi:hypothetical protein